MKFHPLKCYHLRVTKKKAPLDIQYEMLGHNLERVEHYPYLGVEISRDLSWTNHVKKVTSKVNRALGFGDGPEVISMICHWKLQSYSRYCHWNLTSSGPPYRGADRTQDCTCSTEQSKATLLYPSILYHQENPNNETYSPAKVPPSESFDSDLPEQPFPKDSKGLEQLTTRHTRGPDCCSF